MVGTKAPDFSLLDSNEQQVTLSAQKGKNVVLFFFPKAFTSVCTEELCTVRDNLGQYEALNAEVFGISVDPTDVLASYKAEQNYNFPLLSDSTKQVSKAYGSLYDAGVSKRSAFVIDREGVVKYAEVLEDGFLQPDFNAINKTLAALQ
ncbi:MAG TPA: redoxin domain-containing protein [Saprospiraceae bacterium]|nr:redoxin domain-containing protein [Saprospiraceae bacterium]